MVHTCQDGTVVGWSGRLASVWSATIPLAGQQQVCQSSHAMLTTANASSGEHRRDAVAVIAYMPCLDAGPSASSHSGVLAPLLAAVSLSDGNVPWTWKRLEESSAAGAGHNMGATSCQVALPLTHKRFSYQWGGNASGSAQVTAMEAEVGDLIPGESGQLLLLRHPGGGVSLHRGLDGYLVCAEPPPASDASSNRPVTVTDLDGDGNLDRLVVTTGEQGGQATCCAAAISQSEGPSRRVLFNVSLCEAGEDPRFSIYVRGTPGAACPPPALPVHPRSSSRL